MRLTSLGAAGRMTLTTSATAGGTAAAASAPALPSRNQRRLSCTDIVMSFPSQDVGDQRGVASDVVPMVDVIRVAGENACDLVLDHFERFGLRWRQPFRVIADAKILLMPAHRSLQSLRDFGMEHKRSMRFAALGEDDVRLHRRRLVGLVMVRVIVDRDESTGCRHSSTPSSANSFSYSMSASRTNGSNAFAAFNRSTCRNTSLGIESMSCPPRISSRVFLAWAALARLDNSAVTFNKSSAFIVIPTSKFCRAT